MGKQKTDWIPRLMTLPLLIAVAGIVILGVCAMGDETMDMVARMCIPLGGGFAAMATLYGIKEVWMGAGK